jgi:chromosome segregation ATPase
MRWISYVLTAFVCLVALSGCSSREVERLRAELEEMRAQLETTRAAMEQMTAKNTELQTELETARQQIADVQVIKRGYEEARAKVQANLSQLGPLLGTSDSPMPAFEDLKNSDWAGKLLPAGQLPGDLKELENQLKDLLGGADSGAEP